MRTMAEQCTASPPISGTARSSSEAGGEAVDRGVHDAAETAGSQTVQVKRRLNTKTGPRRAAELGHTSHHGGAQRLDLVTAAEAASARKRRRDFVAVHARRAKSAKTEAWNLVHQQPERASSDRDMHEAECVDEEGTVPRCWQAHPSHRAKAPMGAELLFCTVCGAWSAGQRTRGLAQPCRGGGGHVGNLRLLHLGIAPVRGARVPLHLKARGAKGTRGGAAARAPRARRGVG